MVALLVVPEAWFWIAAGGAAILVGYAALRVFAANTVGRLGRTSVATDEAITSLPLFARPLVASGVIVAVLAIVVLLPAVVQIFPPPGPAENEQPDRKRNEAKREAEIARLRSELLRAEHEQARRAVENAARSRAQEELPARAPLQ